MDKYNVPNAPNAPPPYMPAATVSTLPSYHQIESAQNPPPTIYPSVSSSLSQQAISHPAVIIQTTTTRQPIIIGRESVYITCPYCHADILTTVQHKPNSRTHLWAIILCLFICWPCVCLPYCMDSCQSANHYCPNCNTYIGTHVN